VAFTNSLGGRILIGVRDDGSIAGLTKEDILRINQMISNVSSQNVEPPISPFTDAAKVNGQKVMIVEIEKGINKPYCTNKGIYVTKSGADKRKISQEELQRLFQESNKLFADEMKVFGTTFEDLDFDSFAKVYNKIYDEPVDNVNIPKEQLLNNINMMTGQNLTLAGLLLFGKNPQSKRPIFMIKAVSFLGDDMSAAEYRDSEDITGTLMEQYKSGISFLVRNLKKIQVEEGFNSEGRLEVPRLVLEELLVNALVHRNYFLNAPIRLFIFDNRIEFINPGKLPNTLTTENIKYGISIPRNPLMSSFASKLLPYKGVGTGIVRSYKAYPHIKLIDNKEIDEFRAVVYRVNSKS
jgi:ATP-dependent DNA helicase RecG